MLEVNSVVCTFYEQLYIICCIWAKQLYGSDEIEIKIVVMPTLLTDATYCYILQQRYTVYCLGDTITWENI